MKKVLKYIIFALIALILVGTFVFLFKNSRPEKELYQEHETRYGNISRTTVVTGKIEPRNEVNIKPQINGIISELRKEAGQMVKEGDVIAKLRVIPDMNSLSSAQSRVRLAEINLKQAKTNYEREKSLYDKHLVSDEEFDQVLQAYNQAQEEQAAAQESLEVIRDGVSSRNTTGSSTLVRSTITGLILDIPVKVGNSVIQANTMNDGTTVATVADMSDLIFDGNIDETEVGSLVEGMPIHISIGALPDYSAEAALEYISPKAVENNGANQFEIKAAVHSEGEHKIRSGYSANAEIVLEHADSVLTIPESALEFSSDSTFVYLKGAEGYTRVPITTGLSDGLIIEVKSGLKEGDIVRGTRIINFDKMKKQ
ncbi:MAG: efflux RND transporter periplasmic adaptor subunit [Bacteroidales bacterium]|nr:efflux RND transporter periplasmic adaptor subunit [Bacteroidales bacterium]MBP5520795.1 efflux RND transporter periplasmic adaptor subunit [Bacteroidales bacterium]